MTFDINFFRGVATLLLLLSFVLLVIYVSRPKNKKLLEAHAAIPLEEDQPSIAATTNSVRRN
jgi:cbb3-type cytochrome oxidase subunit 3